MCLPYVPSHRMGLCTSVPCASHALSGTAREAGRHKSQHYCLPCCLAMVEGCYRPSSVSADRGYCGQTALQTAQVHHRDGQPVLSRSLACRSDSEEWEPRRTSRGTARSSGGKAATKGASQFVSTPSPSVDKPRHSQQSRQKQKSMQVSARAGCDSACMGSGDPVWPACCQLSQSGCTCMGIRGSIEYMLQPSACFTCLQPYC